jgi:hypothetical protein
MVIYYNFYENEFTKNRKQIFGNRKNWHRFLFIKHKLEIELFLQSI